MSGYVERRALLALYRNHPATGPGDRYNWKAHGEAKQQREMLLGWAATLPDETLLRYRNLGPVALRWIRDQTGDPASPFADIEDENADLRMALAAASAEIRRLQGLADAARRADATWAAYLEAHAGRGHKGQEHTRGAIFEGGCGLCVSAEYGTEIEMVEYVMPALRAALATHEHGIGGTE